MHKDAQIHLFHSKKNEAQNVALMKFMISLHSNRLQINPHEEKFLAWKIYSIVTDHYRPSPSRLRDWISSQNLLAMKHYI
jgi:hypothetical protein